MRRNSLGCLAVGVGRTKYDGLPSQCFHRTILQSRWLIGSAHKLVATLGACKITWLNGALDITQDAQ